MPNLTTAVLLFSFVSNDRGYVTLSFGDSIMNSLITSAKSKPFDVIIKSRLERTREYSKWMKKAEVMSLLLSCDDSKIRKTTG